VEAPVCDLVLPIHEDKIEETDQLANGEGDLVYDAKESQEEMKDLDEEGEEEVING